MKKFLRSFYLIYRNFFYGRKTLAPSLMLVIMGLLTFHVWWMSGPTIIGQVVNLIIKIVFTATIWIGLPCIFYVIDCNQYYKKRRREIDRGKNEKPTNNKSS